MLDDVTSVMVHDSHTLEIVVDRPRNYFPYVLTLPVARPWPRHVCERHGREWRRHELVTCGPYRLESMDAHGVVAVADPDWRGPRGNVGRIEIDFLSLDEMVDHGIGRWRHGEYGVLVAGFRSPTDREQNTLSTTVPSLGAMMVALRPSRPALRCAEVRRAIAAAIDTGALATAVGAAARPAQPAGVLPPAMPGHSARSGTRHDPTAAAELLEQAGYPGGDGLPPLRFAFPAWHRPVAERIVGQLEAVGLRIERVLTDSTLAAQTATDVDLVISSWVADYPDPDGFFRGLVESPGGPLLERDADIDRRLAEARELRDHDLRLAAYQQIDRLCAQQHANLLPLLYIRMTLLRRPWVTGVWSNPMSMLRIAEAVVGTPPAGEDGAAVDVTAEVG